MLKFRRKCSDNLLSISGKNKRWYIFIHLNHDGIPIQEVTHAISDGLNRKQEFATEELVNLDKVEAKTDLYIEEAYGEDTNLLGTSSSEKISKVRNINKLNIYLKIKHRFYSIEGIKISSIITSCQRFTTDACLTKLQKVIF